MVNSIPVRPLKHQEKDRQKESEETETECAGATWENKQDAIIGLAVMRYSAAATLAVFI